MFRTGFNVVNLKLTGAVQPGLGYNAGRVGIIWGQDVGGNHPYSIAPQTKGLTANNGLVVQASFDPYEMWESVWGTCVRLPWYLIGHANDTITIIEVIQGVEDPQRF